MQLKLHFYRKPINYHRMKLLLQIALTFGLLPFFGISQETISTSLIQVDSTANSSEWISYIDHEKFSIEYSYYDCDPNMGFDYQGVLLRVTNKTSQKLALSWHKILYYAETCRTCNFPEEYHYDLSIEPNQTVEGDCNPQSGYNLKLFSKFIDASYTSGDHLTAFQLADFSITEY